MEERAEEEGTRQDGVQQKLKEDVEADRGKLRKEVTSTLNLDQVPNAVLNYDSFKCIMYYFKVETSFLQDKNHKQSITCVCLSRDGGSLYTASKDKGLVKWELPTGRKLVRICGGRKGEEESTQGHCHTITCLAVSSDNKFLASGDTNKSIFVWSCESMTKIHVFKGKIGNYLVERKCRN